MRWVRVAVAVSLLLFGVAVARPASADVDTIAGGTLRTGWYDDEPQLGPAAVTASDFGQRWSTSVAGQVYAQTLVHDGIVLVATENDDVYGLDEASGATVWHRHLHTPWDPSEVGCADLTPTVGITGTPVIDPATDTAYFYAKTYATGSSGPAAWFLHAVDVSTGAERAGFPVAIHGTATNAPGTAFDPTREMQRPGLLLLDGVVYAGFGGHCTAFPYQGWVVGVNASTGAIRTLWVTTDQANGQLGAGIWQSGGGLVSDHDGSIVLATGNGTPPSAPTPGDQPPAVGFGVSVVRLDVQADGSLQPSDFFTPHDAGTLDTGDVDLGSGAPVELPAASFGTAAHPHLIVQVGKDGTVWLLDADHLGGFQQGTSGGDDVVGRFGPDGGVWSKPTPWGGDGGWVYITTAAPGSGNTGSSGFLHAYRYGVDGGGAPSLALTGASSDGFGFGSGTPVVTSSGTASGSAVVWTVWMANPTSTTDELRAYAPVPVNGTMQLLRSFPIGAATKFSAPVADGGRLFLGTRDGHVLAFGRPVNPSLTAPAVAFGAVTVGQNASANATFTAQQPVTVTSAATNDAAFTVGTPTPPFGTPLAAGATITVPVTFSPGGVGPASAVLTLTSAAGISTTAVSGTGLAVGPSLAADPSSVSFGAVTVHDTSTAAVTIGNAGSQPLHINTVTGPPAPFTATGLPAPGATIAPGTTQSFSVSYSPSVVGSNSGAIDITSDGGTAHIALNGSGALPGKLVVATTTVAFPATPTGGWAERAFTVSNTGGRPVTVTRSKPPITGGFSAISDLPEGSSIPAGGSVTLRVRFAPTAPGNSSSTWSLNGDGASTQTNVTFTGTGLANVGIPSPLAGGWLLNGASTIQGSDVVLTPATPNVAGSAVWPTAVDPSHLRATFDAVLDSGTGADGLTFALLPAATDPHATGTIGSGLGWAGLGGIAVTLDTFQSPGDPSANFVGITTSSVNGSVVYDATATAVPPLRGTPRHVVIATGGGHLTVSIDGTIVLDRAVTLPPSALVAFTAATGGLTDRHAVRNVVFALPTTPTQAFVLAAYHDFLSRSPTASELSAAAASLDGGTPRSTFVRTLANSPEWVNTIVEGLYEQTLGRASDPGGLAYWSGLIRNGTLTVAQVAAQFYASPEYYSGFGGGTDASWVRDLYVKILHREPDSSGWNYWIGATQQQGRFVVAYAFYQSSESAHARVRQLYLALLGREPDAGGWDFWSTQVVPLGDITLATALASSDEYLQRAVATYAF